MEARLAVDEGLRNMHPRGGWNVRGAHVGWDMVDVAHARLEDLVMVLEHSNFGILVGSIRVVA